MDRAKRVAARGPSIRTGRREALRSTRVIRERSVLVIEADPEVQSQMARTLRRSGLRIVGASSGDAALALIREWDVDLILVSEDLPGRAGVEVARVLHGTRPRTKVVMMMVTSEPDAWEAALEAGAAGCVPKPLELHSLAPWLGRASTVPPAKTIPRDDAPAVAE
jgi:CheY-like chemotaxis protein